MTNPKMVTRETTDRNRMNDAKAAGNPVANTTRCSRTGRVCVCVCVWVSAVAVPTTDEEGELLCVEVTDADADASTSEAGNAVDEGEKVDAYDVAGGK
jgi:hypothetical protein